jgi:hypothetical protein
LQCDHGEEEDEDDDDEETHGMSKSASRSVKEMLEALQPSPNETTFAK